MLFRNRAYTSIGRAATAALGGAGPRNVRAFNSAIVSRWPRK